MLHVITCTERYNHILSLYSSLMNGFIEETKINSFYGSQPISLMAESIVHIVEKRSDDQEFLYNLTAKLDGTRMLLFLHPLLNGNIVFIDRLMKFYEPIRPFKYNVNNVCLMDGEMYDHVFFVFDIIYYNGFICEYAFETRLRTLIELLTANRDRFTDNVVSIITANTGIHIVQKLYMEMKGFNEEILSNIDLYKFVCDDFNNNTALKNTGLVFPLRFDGLIFTPRFTKYILADNWKYPHNILYKWKPSYHETIDFVLEKRMMQKKIVTIGLVEGSRGTNIPFLTDTKNKQYAVIEHNNDIIINSSNVFECRYDQISKRFVVVRSRNDKTNHPNNLRTAKSLWVLLTRSVDINAIKTIILGQQDIFQCPNIPDWQKSDISTKEIVSIKDTVINRFNRQNGHKGISQEFEVRLGNCSTKGFNTYIKFANYRWLKQTLNTLNIPYVTSNSIDVFDKNQHRTSYDTNVRCIFKHKHDIKDYNTSNVFGYDFRIAVSTEENMYNEHIRNNIGYHKHIQLPNTKMRNKHRLSYSFTPNFQIDMTEFTTSLESKTFYYQVEIELKPFRHFVDINELNSVILFVLRNLYGNYRII